MRGVWGGGGRTLKPAIQGRRGVTVRVECSISPLILVRALLRASQGSYKYNALRRVTDEDEAGRARSQPGLHE
jgi:hypothetical protein